MNRLILFLLTFFTPIGFNYMYLGQRKKGILFIIFFIFIIGNLLTGIVYGLINPLIILIIFSLFIAIDIVSFYDCLSVRKKLKHGLIVENNLDSIILFLKNNIGYVIVFASSIIAIYSINDIEFDNILYTTIIPRFIKGSLIFQLIFMIGKVFIYISNNEDNKIYDEIALQKANREASNKLHKTIEDKNAVEILKVGYTNLDTIHELSLLLRNANISKYITEIESTTIKILNFIEKYPHKAKNTKKFIDYYLPTTVNLINNYYHLYSQNLSGKNIHEGLVKIEKAIINIEQAFKAQLDSLFEDKTIDIVSEINVLSSILKTDGLVEDTN